MTEKGVPAVPALISAAADEAADKAVEKLLASLMDVNSVAPVVFEKAVADATEKAVNATLARFGIDPSKPVDAAKDFGFIRAMRETYEAGIRHGVLVLIASIIGGIALAVWNSVRSVGR